MTAPVTDIEVAAYTVPTDAPEADGTLAWDSTTLVVVHASAGGERGVGWTYADAAAATLVAGTLADVVRGLDALSPPRAFDAMRRACRNLGTPGLGSMAIAAVDCALWDVKAKLLGLPLCDVLGRRRDEVPLYGSGGFTSYPEARLREQLAGWVEEGIPRVKMKVGTQPGDDPRRVRAAREAIGPEAELFVDANGAYTETEALALAERFRAEAGVSWFEEPRSSDDLSGLRAMRERGPVGMAIAAGEYGWDSVYFRRMLAAGAVDVLQADVTRCGGVTGWLDVAALAAAFETPFSAHCAPSLHRHPALAARQIEHVEWFHDHVRIEQELFDGAPVAEGGTMRPDLSRPGIGVELKTADARRYAV